MKKKVFFYVNNEIVLEERSDMLVDSIEKMKFIIAEECSCQYDDVEVKFEDLPHDLSEIDVAGFGLFDWTEPYPKTITGIKLNLVIGSDEYLDALSSNTLEKYLVFN